MSWPVPQVYLFDRISLVNLTSSPSQAAMIFSSLLSSTALIVASIASVSLAQTTYTTSTTCSVPTSIPASTPSAVINVNRVVDNGGSYTASIYVEFIIPEDFQYSLTSFSIYPTTGDPPVTVLCNGIDKCSVFNEPVEIDIDDFSVNADLSLRTLHFEALFQNANGNGKGFIYVIGCEKDVSDIDVDIAYFVGPGAQLVPAAIATTTQSARTTPTSSRATTPVTIPSSATSPQEVTVTDTTFVDVSATCITSTYTVSVNPTSCITLTTTITQGRNSTGGNTGSIIPQGLATSLQLPVKSMFALLTALAAALVI